MSLAREFIACCNCEVERTKEMLYRCIKPDCSKIGQIYCEDCGQSAHKRKNHKFDIHKDHIKLVKKQQIDHIQSQISGGLSVLKKTVNTHNEQTYSIVRQGYSAALISGSASYIIAEIIGIGDNVARLSSVSKSILKGATDIGKQGLLMGAVTDVAMEASKLAAEGALAGALVMAGFEVALQTARFMNGEISTWEEYGYHVSKGFCAAAGMGLFNWGGTTVGITIGSLAGGPIGGIIGGVIGGLFAGIAGVKAGRWVFDQVWSDDFITDKQHGREQMIRDSLKLFGILDIKDIENAAIFNKEDLKRTYRSLAKKYHPDKNGGSPESHAKFHEINAALGVLLSLLTKKDKTKIINKLTEVRAIKWKSDISKLCKILKQKKLMYIVDVCSKWNENVTIEFLSKMRKTDILEMIKDLNADEKYKYTIHVIEKNQFVNVIQKWSGKNDDALIDAIADRKMHSDSDCKANDDINDDIEYDDIEELRDELRKKKVLDVAKICEEYDEDLTLDALLEYTKTDLLQLLQDISDDESNAHKISVVKKNKFAKIIRQAADKQCELCLSK